MVKTANEVIIVGFAQAATVIDMHEHIATQVAQCSVISAQDFLDNKSCRDTPHIIAVGLDLDLRRELVNHADNAQYALFTYIDPTSRVSPTAQISPGCFVAPFCFVAAGAYLAQHVIMAPYCMVNHNSRIGRGSILHPGSAVAGSTNIGQFCRLSLKATVIDHLDICDDVQLGANGMLTKSVTEPGRYLGSPARKIVTAPGCQLGDRLARAQH